MGDIIDMIQYHYIDFDTEYQREQNLWDDTQQSRLIESVLLGLRLPAFYFEEVSKKKWRIIDGLQRCCTIRNFYVDKTLRLQNMEFLTDFEGKTIDDFPFEIKRDIRMLPVTVNVLENGVPDDVKYILFKRLNTGGITLSTQEIRKCCIYRKGHRHYKGNVRISSIHLGYIEHYTHIAQARYGLRITFCGFLSYRV